MVGLFDIAPTELLLVALVALVVIGPKDLPKAMRVVGKWVGRARGMARQFRSGFDTMVREAELEEMQRKWAAENARIMAEHPMLPDPDAPPSPSPSTSTSTPTPTPTPPSSTVEAQAPMADNSTDQQKPSA
jgi:sec-independent protein translocase protein TatB